MVGYAQEEHKIVVLFHRLIGKRGSLEWTSLNKGCMVKDTKLRTTGAEDGTGGSKGQGYYSHQPSASSHE